MTRGNPGRKGFLIPGNTLRDPVLPVEILQSQTFRGQTFSTNRFLHCRTSQSLNNLIAYFDFPRNRVPNFLSLFTDNTFHFLSFSYGKDYLVL